MTAPLLDIRDLGKTFTMHLQGGLLIPVVSGVSLTVAAGECVVLGGPSGAGKSSILKMIYGNYRADSGAIAVVAGDETVDVASAAPRRVLALRRTTIGYVSQFLRVIPRVPALAVVAEGAGRERGRGPWAPRPAGVPAGVMAQRAWNRRAAASRGGEPAGPRLSPALLVQRRCATKRERQRGLGARCDAKRGLADGGPWWWSWG